MVNDQAEIRVVRLNRPEAMNSLSRKMAEEVLDALTGFAGHPGLRALIVTGIGETAFCAGGDIKEMEEMGYRSARSYAVLAHKIINLIEGTGKPVVSAVNGLALGAGCDLAFACDLCVASENAKFGMPSLKVGVITPFGGMSRLAARIGVSRAKSMIFTGSLIDAAEARSMGLVHSVLPGPDLLQGAVKLTQAMLDRAPVAFALGKKLLTENASSRQADAREIEYYAQCFRTKDQKEGARAFRAKRKPVFRGV